MYYLVSYPDVIIDGGEHINVVRGIRYDRCRILIEAAIKYGIYYVYDCDDNLTLIGDKGVIAEFLLTCIIPFEFSLCEENE